MNKFLLIMLCLLVSVPVFAEAIPLNTEERVVGWDKSHTRIVYEAKTTEYAVFKDGLIQKVKKEVIEQREELNLYFILAPIYIALMVTGLLFGRRRGVVALAALTAFAVSMTITTFATFAPFAAFFTFLAAITAVVGAVVVTNLKDSKLYQILFTSGIGFTLIASALMWTI